MDQNYDGVPMDADKRRFTGIWIPAEIWTDDQLSGLAKMLYAEIASFGERGCWKKSEELMAPLGIRSATFQQLCRQLRERGYISEKRMFGRVVRTTTLGFQSSAQNPHQCESRAVHQAEWQADEQAESRAVHKEYSKNKERVKGEQNKKEPAENSYGRADLNELVTLWESETSISIKGQQNQRRQLYNLLRKHGADKTRAIIKLAGKAIKSNDRYAPLITTPSDLTGRFEKLSKLQLWESRNQVARSFGNHQPTPAPKMAVQSIKVAKTDYGGAWDEISDEEREKVSRMMKQARKNLLK